MGGIRHVKRKGPAPREHKSRQKIAGGGKFQSERQRRFLWAVAPKAARKWAHNLKTRKPDWIGARRSTGARRGR